MSLHLSFFHAFPRKRVANILLTYPPLFSPRKSRLHKKAGNKIHPQDVSFRILHNTRAAEGKIVPFFAPVNDNVRLRPLPWGPQPRHRFLNPFPSSNAPPNPAAAAAAHGCAFVRSWGLNGGADGFEGRSAHLGLRQDGGGAAGSRGLPGFRG